MIVMMAVLLPFVVLFLGLIFTDMDMTNKWESESIEHYIMFNHVLISIALVLLCCVSEHNFYTHMKEELNPVKLYSNWDDIKAMTKDDVEITFYDITYYKEAKDLSSYSRTVLLVDHTSNNPHLAEQNDKLYMNISTDYHSNYLWYLKKTEDNSINAQLLGQYPKMD